MRIRDTLDTDTAAILLLDTDRAELVARAAVGIEEVERGVRIPVGRGFAGRVAAEARPIVLSDVDHADVLNPLLRAKGIKSLLGVPLIVSGTVLGIAHVGTLTPRTFDDADIDLLQLAADRAALAIEHARAFEAERRARQRLENVQAVTDVALAHLELDQLLAELLPRIRDILAVDTTAILLLDERRDELVARAALGIEEEVEQGVRIPVGRGFAGRIAASRQPVVLDEVNAANVINPILLQKGIRSLLGVPLVAHGEIVGVVHVGSLTPRVFEPEETELLQLVAERIGLAIEKAQVHDELLRLDRLKLDFVAVASHELRTPATAVYGVVETLRSRGASLEPDVRTHLEDVLWEQANRLRRLIEQLLDLSRLDSGRIEIAPERLRLATTLTEIARPYGLEIGAPITIDVPSELEVVVDRLVLERTISNLLANAVRHGRPPIAITTAASNGSLRVTVADAGLGVQEDVVARLFDRFERGSFETQGTGLGLSIAKAYALAHGGDLVYERGDPGARFELVLPGALR